MSNWDSEIDEVARQMTAGEPDAAFTDRLLARIDTSEQVRRRGWPMWVWPSAALATMAVVALMIGWEPSRSGDTRPSPAGMPELTLRSETPVAAPGAQGNETARRSAPQPAPVRANRALAALTTAVPRASPAGGGLGPAYPDSLTLPPIDIEPIAERLVEAMESIQIPQLAVVQLAVPVFGE